MTKDVARVDVTPGGAGRQARLMKPYLFAALDAVPPVHPLAAQARATLESWDGSAFADAVSSTSLEPGAVIFNKWRTVVQQNTFGDEMKGSASQAGFNVLMHALDDALREEGPCADLGGSCVPPSRDYFNGKDPNEVLSRAFDDAVADPAVWSTVPRAPITFTHFIVGKVAQIPGSARMTWVHNVTMGRPITSETILTLGQSGFIRTGDGSTVLFDPHFADQLPLYRNFEYKTMPFYRTWRLER
jgi:hypothetical protein